MISLIKIKARKILSVWTAAAVTVLAVGCTTTKSTAQGTAKPKPATAATKAANAKLLKQLPFDNTKDFENAAGIPVRVRALAQFLPHRRQGATPGSESAPHAEHCQSGYSASHVARHLLRLPRRAPQRTEGRGKKDRAAADPFGRTNGIGDSVVLTLLGPNRLDGWVWGVGPTFLFPTATEDVLGQQKYQMGPGGLIVHLGNEEGKLSWNSFNVGALAQHWWSYADASGGSDRDETAFTDIQYFVNWRYNKTQLIGMTPNVQINWREDDISFPIGLGTIGLATIGNTPVRWGIEVQYYALQFDDFGPEWNFKIFIAPIAKNPFKSE